ncbi:hypothetical protein M0R45_007123 [Rubus argutus]|uniref:Uncharacterized protein n=1 Tax=Rubus argutus TaxID=59490 RepID=A0AAW1YT08_RUBAR
MRCGGVVIRSMRQRGQERSERRCQRGIDQTGRARALGFLAGQEMAGINKGSNNVWRHDGRGEVRADWAQGAGAMASEFDGEGVKLGLSLVIGDGDAGGVSLIVVMTGQRSRQWWFRARLVARTVGLITDARLRLGEEKTKEGLADWVIEWKSGGEMMGFQIWNGIEPPW